MKSDYRITFPASVLMLIVFAVMGCDSRGNGTFPLLSVNISPPSIDQLSPNTAPVGSPTFTMIVKGSNFAPAAVVFWHDKPLRTTFINSNQLMVQVTDVDLQMAGLAPVFVQTAGQNSNTVNFDVLIQ